MALFGRKRPPEIQRAEAARKAIEQHGEPRPVVRHTLDKVEAAIAVAIDDRDRIDESLTGLDQERIAAELKAALRAKPDPTAADPPTVMSLRKRHEAVHALQNRREDIDSAIERALVDLETLVAQTAMHRLGASDDAMDDLGHWLGQLDDDVRALADAHDVLARLQES
jgi:hypothetical protein